MFKPAVLAGLALAPLVLLAHEAQGPGRAAQIDRSLAVGRIERIEPERGTVLVKHGPIANLGMPDMTMRFRLADSAQAASLRAGEVVRFHAERRRGTLVITDVTRP